MGAFSYRIVGGFWGLLVGDALGVPYEFHHPLDIPSLSDIEMDPPRGYRVSYPNVPRGTWSDDGAQALCLLDSLLEHGHLNLDDFARRIVAWYDKGLWAVDNHVFDVGNQTSDAIRQIKRGVSPEQAGFVNPDGKGNGALMRVLPLALWHKGTDGELIEDAHRQSLVTHGAITNQVCCALYCLWARGLLQGQDADAAYAWAVETLRVYYGQDSEYREDLETTVRPDAEPWTDGSGFVVSTLHCARLAMKEPNYEAVVKKAIAYGNDTDTNAAVAGGLAGIRGGVGEIPERWMQVMRGRKMAEGLLEQLLLQ